MQEMIKIPSTLKSYSSAGQKSVNVKFQTQENLSPEQISLITNNEGNYGHLLFLHETTEESELLQVINSLPKLQVDKNEKTPQERLRGVLFVLYDKKCKDGRSFDEFYRTYINQMIDKIKEQLD